MKTLENENVKTLEQVPPEIGGLQLISRKTAAKLIDCNPTFIDKLIQSGKLTSVRLGERKGVRIPLQSFKEFLSSCHNSAT